MTNFYKIKVRGYLDSQWSEWFDGLTVTREACGDTLLSGPVRDQAALYGLLKKIRDLGLPLLLVKRIDQDENHEKSDQSPVNGEQL